MVLAATLFGGAFGLASASAHTSAPGLGHGVTPVAAGIVQGTPGSDSFTIEEPGGTTETIDVLSSSTTYVERGMPSASLADVASGDLVAVFGTVSGSTVTASEVVIAVPRGAAHGETPAVAGIVQGTPSSDSFTIETRGGTSETVDVSDATVYCERGVPSASLTNVAAGDLVAVFGTVSGSTVTASLVVIHSDFHHGFAVAGVVQGTPGSTSFTIQTRGGVSDTIDVSASTKYYERGVGSVSLSDVASGDHVGVFGTISGTTVTANAVLIAAPPATSGSFVAAGTVQTTPTADSFVIETWGHVQLTVEVSGSTTYVEHGSTAASLTDVAITDDVAVFGTISGSTVTATQIVIGGNEPGHPGHFGPSTVGPAGGQGGSGQGGNGGQGGSGGGPVGHSDRR
jgi:hypothetical protein